MTDVLVLAVSAAVVALLALIAQALGFRVKGRFADAAAVGAAVARVEPRAVVRDAVIDGAWAIALLEDGRLAVARAVGDSATARILCAGAPRPRVKRVKTGVRIIVPGFDMGFPGGALRLATAPAWLTSRTDQTAHAR